jgi:GxxExxY protein
MAAKTAKELNDLSNRIIGIAIDIHKKLGPGFQEKIYEGALFREFKKSGIGYEKQKVTKESIIEKTHLTDSHPPPNLPLEGGGN